MLQYWQGKTTNYTMFATAFYLECQWHLQSLWKRTKRTYQNLHYKWVQKVSTYQVSLLECKMKQSGTQVPLFQSNLSPPTSGQKNLSCNRKFSENVGNCISDYVQTAPSETITLIFTSMETSVSIPVHNMHNTFNNTYSGKKFRHTNFIRLSCLELQ
jgi:hypothetical protein